MENMEEYQIPEEAIERLQDPEIIRRQMKEGKIFQDIIGYSPDVMDKFYSGAYLLFQKQEYQQAADAFVFLTTLNPYVHNYWLGLGMSEQLSGGYQGALLAYAMGILTNLENPVCHYQSAMCYKALDDKDSAIKSLDMALLYAGDQEEFKTLRDLAILNKERFENG